MKKLFYKFGMAGLLSLLLLGFSQIGISNEIFDLSKDTMILAEVTEEVSPVAEAAEETPTLDTGDTAWMIVATILVIVMACLLYTSPSPRDATLSRMPSSA